MHFAVETAPQHTTYHDMLVVWQAADDIDAVESAWTFEPVQRPHPPIVIGGVGERRTLRTVARWAQHWNLPGGGVEVYRQKYDVLRRHCDDIGRDVATITISTHLRPDSSRPSNFDSLLREIEAFQDAGLDLGIIRLLQPHTPAVLEPLAKAITPFAG